MHVCGRSYCPGALLPRRRRFRFRLAGRREDVGMATGATIHTANGLKVVVERREAPPAGPTAEQKAAASVA